ncbi:MAG: ribonucleoside triphosphate reductase, partial [Bacillota bacterium]
RGFQYPIPTYSITKNFDWSDTENNRLLFEMTSKYGTPYFSNYINSDMEPSDIRSMCCRLRLDLRELRKKSGGYFGSGESTGSVGVVTINMPRIAYQSKDEKEFFARLDRLMDISARSLKTKRTVITKLLEEGLYPYTKRYLGTFANHFSTIGLVGMNEATLNAAWLRKDLTHPEAQEFTKRVLNHMRERLSDYQEQYGDLYNLEATPAESTTYRFAKHDKEQFPDIITANENGTPYYTNSSHLPVGFTEDIFDALDIQDDLQTLYTSGTVFHAFLGEKLPDWKAAASLVKKIADNYKLPYYTLSPTYSICKDHGYLAGEQYTCPHCGQKTEVYSRITGYYRPVQNWNDGKTQEFKDRKVYDINHSTLKGHKHAEEKTEACCAAPALDGPVLFTRDGCPNCKTSKMMLDKAGVKYRVINAEQDAATTRKYGVKKAPSLLVPDGDGFKTYDNASEIRKYIESIG